MLERQNEADSEIPPRHVQDFRLMKSEFVKQLQQSSGQPSSIGQQFPNSTDSTSLHNQVDVTHGMNVSNQIQNGRDSSKAVVVALIVAICALLAKKVVQYIGYNVLQL
eukprot:TRINITY_DN10591_c0_g1_i9.p4 TRINITY_DN10591_c0_g1~~TRINITY_DN10591_c0_g1_i9.p4  ORF type:complete len:108 (-),score=13.54 TRINITY_DN10591_c0_g1_i9:446-769(-)